MEWISIVQMIFGGGVVAGIVEVSTNNKIKI